MSTEPIPNATAPAPGDLIASLVAHAYPPGAAAADIIDVRVRSVAIEPSLRDREVALVSALDMGKHLAVVSDQNTHAAMGQRVERALGAAFHVQSVVLPAAPHADDDTLHRLKAALHPSTDALIAVGSGTINDLCKKAAAELGRPYAVFGTAPSMNGYASENASITVRGLKSSLPARAPAGVFLDLEVLAKAPLRLIRCGIGESLCRCTAQSDWLLAHMFLDEAYRETPFVLLASEEDELFAHSDALVRGDLQVMGRLARTLVLSGFGMTICGGSYPASQGEHLISHLMEMTRGAHQPGAYHGEQIGVTTLAMAGLQERILGFERPPVLRPSWIRKEEVIARFGAALGEMCWRELGKKLITEETAPVLNERLQTRWDAIRSRIRAALRPVDELRSVLRRAGAPASATELGWSPDAYQHACNHAREIRARFTFLDLAAEWELAVA